ncbi:hypothetical protein [Mesorhizobium sp.]|uniref:hypothetical protein n=1 Tax=Mesorhizobium sp. TaxID=1871066 RepID=UPI000FE9EA72|nr:hypothetical protein [Mesorhizobium sp.]RWQ59652.1 MAG: hypothetical protein EOS83_09585 [Mesorhizobium sp.]
MDSHPDPVRVGEALGVRYVLEGQVRKIGERVSISLTLSETDQGTVVWSDKIQRPFEEILALVMEPSRGSPRPYPDGWRTQPWWRRAESRQKT